MISSGIALTRRRLSTAVPVTCSASEAFVETLVAHKVEKVFGIVGSAFIDPLDLFPAAGIDFIDVQHEQNAVHMADSYSRMTGKVGVAIGQKFNCPI